MCSKTSTKYVYNFKINYYPKRYQDKRTTMTDYLIR